MLPRCLLSSFESVGLPVQEKKQKINFQDGRHGGHLGLLIERIFCYVFIYKPPPYFLSSFESTDLPVQKTKRKINFHDGRHGGHLGFPIETILAVFDLQVTSMLLTKFRVNWPFGSGIEAK